MRNNQNLIRSMICDNPKFKDLITLYPFGLGAAPAKCHIFSGDNNLGDGVTDCTAADASQVQMPWGYTLR